MRILDAERVIRLHVEFDEAESAHLKEMGAIPPWAKVPAHMWMTLDEIAGMENRGEIPKGTFDALPLTVLTIRDEEAEAHAAVGDLPGDDPNRQRD
jgi:hypothetical protein